MKSKLALMSVLLITTLSASAQEKLSGFEMKKYTDPDSIVRLFLRPLTELESPDCLSRVLTSPGHQAYIALGHTIESITLQLSKKDRTFIGIVEYVPIEKGPWEHGARFTVACAVAEENASKGSSSGEGAI